MTDRHTTGIQSRAASLQRPSFFVVLY